MKRWEQTADLLQNALIRLNRALHVVAPASTQAFLGLASEQIRRELIDLARHYCGPHGHDRHYIGSVDDTQTPEAESDLHDHQELELWTALHVSVTTLPTWEREVFDLRFYYGWTPKEIADFYKVSLSTVQRGWRSAAQHLREKLGGKLPED